VVVGVGLIVLVDVLVLVLLFGDARARDSLPIADHTKSKSDS